MAGFGLIQKFEFLQNFSSALIASVNPAIIHNLEKYYILKKVHFLSSIEDIDGDYLEFGVFTGSSFSHSIRCCRSLAKTNKKILNTKFYGFDSFAGFGQLNNEDKHHFYTDENFKTNLSSVERRISKVAKNISWKLVPGFFNDSLKDGAFKMGIKKSRIIFIDCDTYSSAVDALNFCIPTIQEGTYIILDDFFSYKGNNQKGISGAFNNFVLKADITIRQVFFTEMVV